MRTWTDEIVQGTVDRHDDVSPWFARSRADDILALWADAEGVQWCRGHDLDSPAARALRVVVAL